MNTENIPFKLKVILGKATLSKSDYSNIEPGDILILDQKINAPVALEIGNEKVLEGYIGTNDHLKAVKIQ